MGNIRFSCLDVVPIFQNLSELEKLEISKIANHKHFEKGEIIYHQGSSTQDLYIVHTGNVKVSRISRDGKEQFIRNIPAGDFTGELALILGDIHQDFATVTEPTQICMLDGASFKELLERYPDISLKLLKEMSVRLKESEDTIEELGILDVESRIIKKLLELSAQTNTINLPYSKRDLASLLGITSETLSRKLTQLQTLGYIKMEGHRYIYLLEKKKLETLV